MFSLKGRVVVVSGASSGLGAQMAKGYADQGADLVILARRIERLEALAQEIRKKGVKYDQSTPVDNCPHCGKKLKVNEDGYCLECDVDIDTGEYGFVLSDIKSIE